MNNAAMKEQITFHLNKDHIKFRVEFVIQPANHLNVAIAIAARLLEEALPVEACEYSIEHVDAVFV